jgi:DNA-directed RNA polymerase specialized sigma24 family protein
LSYHDASQKLRISAGMVRKHLLRGRLTLISKLDLKS